MLQIKAEIVPPESLIKTFRYTKQFKLFCFDIFLKETMSKSIKHYFAANFHNRLQAFPYLSLKLC